MESAPTMMGPRGPFWSDQGPASKIPTIEQATVMAIAEE